MRDPARPHRFPTPVPDGDIIAWECAECGEWISEYRYDEQGPCPVDWRRPDRWHELWRAIVAVIRRG